jgi:hypothetical protein
MKKLPIFFVFAAFLTACALPPGNDNGGNGYFLLSYNGNGATSGAAPAVQKYSGTPLIVADQSSLQKANAVFKNWNTRPDGSGESAIPGEEVNITGDITLYAQWTAIPDGGRVFWSIDFRTNSLYQVAGALLAENDSCVVYYDTALPAAQIATLKSNADKITSEYKDRIRAEVEDNFGKIEFMSGNSYNGVNKAVFLLQDIQDGYDGRNNTGYTGGFFSRKDMLAKSNNKNDSNLSYYSNETAMMYCDTYPTIFPSSYSGVTANSALDPGADLYSTMAHELQHLANYSQTVAKGKPALDTWINEGCSMASQDLYAKAVLDSGVETKAKVGLDEGGRINFFVSDQIESPAYPGYIGDGNTCFVWEGGTGGSGSSGNLGDYATAYLFLQWMRIHAKDGIAIYKDIINSGKGDYSAVTAAAAAQISGDFSDWPTMLRTWMLSNYYYDNNGGTGEAAYIGYGKDAEFTKLINTAMNTVKSSPYLHAWSKLITRPAWSTVASGTGYGYLYPGEGVYSNISGGSYKLPGTDSGAHVGYAGLAEAVSSLDTAGAEYSGSVLLSYNGNGNTSGQREKAYVADTDAAASQNASSPRFADGETALNGMVDWRLIARTVASNVAPSIKELE